MGITIPTLAECSTHRDLSGHLEVVSEIARPSCRYRSTIYATSVEAAPALLSPLTGSRALVRVRA